MKTMKRKKSSIHRRFRFDCQPPTSIGLAVSAVVLLCGCASPRVVPSRSQPALTAQVKPGLSICVLDPKLTYETTGNEEAVDGSRFGANEVKADLVRTASDALTTNGFSAQRPGDLSLASELSAESDELLRTAKSAATLERLEALGKRLPVDAVLVQCFRVKIGPGGSWDPNTGAITSAMNSGHLRAAILDTRGGRVWWRNEVYLREVPRVDRKNYRRAVDALYQQQNANEKH